MKSFIFIIPNGITQKILFKAPSNREETRIPILINKFIIPNPIRKSSIFFTQNKAVFIDPRKILIEYNKHVKDTKSDE